MTHRFLVSAFTSIALTAASSGSVVVTAVSSNNNTFVLQNPYLASADDLLNGLLPVSSTGTFNMSGTGGVNVLTDGITPSVLSRNSLPAPEPTNFQFSSFASGGISGTPAGAPGGSQLLYQFTTPSSIASINVLGGWQDGGRDQQSYSIWYAVASNPMEFSLLTTVSYNPTDSTPVATGTGGNGKPTATQVTITDTTGVLATDVAFLRFDFNGTENGYSGYSEIDVLAVPEPNTLALLGVGAFGLGFWRRRSA
jgi:hypothetical protein